MKRIIFLPILMMVTISSMAQNKNAVDAAVSKFQNFYNLQQPDSFFNMLSEKGQSTLTPEKAKLAISSLYQQYGKLVSCEKLHEDAGLATYKSTFQRITLTLLVVLGQDNKLETFRFLPYKEESANDTAKKAPSNFVYKSATGNIYGTLTLPDGSKKVPVVLIISGSGPTDRDCNSSLGLKSNAFLMLADSLKKAGIASLRYDKRGIGESAKAMKDEENMRLDDYINDAAAIIKMLKNDSRFAGVYVAGHSEGSLIGMIAAGKVTVAGYISIAGMGEGMDKVIDKQIRAQSAEMADKAKIILDSIRNGYTAKDIPEELFNLFHISVQPYLHSCLRYNPQTEIKKLKIPVLLIQGTTDLQVGIEEAELLKKAQPKARLVMVKGMNHVMKQAPADREQNFATYNKPELPLSPGFVPDLVKFINQSK